MLEGYWGLYDLVRPLVKVTSEFSRLIAWSLLKACWVNFVKASMWAITSLNLTEGTKTGAKWPYQWYDLMVYFPVCIQSLQSCLTLCDPMDCSPPVSSVHGILQARILEWLASPFSRGSSQSRDQTQVSCITGRFFTTEPLGKSHGLQEVTPKVSHCREINFTKIG